jgi:hypothetical protein
VAVFRHAARAGVIQRGVSDVAAERIHKDAILRPERCYRGTAFHRISLAKDFQQVSREKIFNG